MWIGSGSGIFIYLQVSHAEILGRKDVPPVSQLACGINAKLWRVPHKIRLAINEVKMQSWKTTDRSFTATDVDFDGKADSFADTVRAIFILLLVG